MASLLFDLDGTLLDTITDLTNSVNHALSAAQLPLRSKNEVRAFLGNGIRNLLAQCVPTDCEQTVEETVFQTFKTHYAQHNCVATTPYEGVLPLLEQLQTQGHRMGILSNKVDSAVKVLNEKFFSSYITAAWGETAERPRKPAPEAVWALMEQLGAQTEQTYYIGDSEVDFHCARAAGIKSVLVLWGFRDKTDLYALGADYYIAQPHELLDILREESSVFS